MIETTGEGKSAVATPDGKSRNKKKTELNMKSTKTYIMTAILIFSCNVLQPCYIKQFQFISVHIMSPLRHALSLYCISGVIIHMFVNASADGGAKRVPR